MAGGEGPCEKTKLSAPEVKPVYEVTQPASTTSESQAHSRDHGDETPRLLSEAKQLLEHVPTWWTLFLVLPTIIYFLVSKLPATHQDFGGEVMRRQISRRIEDQTSRYKELEWQEMLITNSTLTQIKEINAVIEGLTDNVRVLEGLLTRSESKGFRRSRQFPNESRSFIVKNRVSGNVLGVSCDLKAFAKTYRKGVDEAIQWRFIPKKVYGYETVVYLLQNSETGLILDLPVDPAETAETLDWNRDKHGLVWKVESKGDKVFRILNVHRQIYLCEGSAMTLEKEDCVEGRDEWILQIPK